MRKRFFLCLPVLLAVLLIGCGKAPAGDTSVPETTAETAPTLPQPTTPPDGNPNDVTCKGSYTGTDLSGTAARLGDKTLSMEALQVWYWSAVADYAAGGAEAQPDFTQGLDTQPCPIDESVNSWQQYFLKTALNNWHTAQALALQSESWQQPLDPAYEILEEKHQECLVDIPATKWLYGYNRDFQPNTLHQAWLDALPEQLKAAGGAQLTQAAFAVNDKTVLEAAKLQNYAYMFFTELTYGLEDQAVSEAETAETMETTAAAEAGETPASLPAGERLVDIRHILLTPEAGETAEACQARAEKLLKTFQKTWAARESDFAVLAHDNSQDTATALDGGRYEAVAQGQLPAELDAWCFDISRQSGDTVVLTTELGSHILYFSQTYALADWEDSQAERRAAEEAFLEEARKAYPLNADYQAITLAEADGSFSITQLLYPDVAHERFPEIPLYLQQDFGKTWYGSYRLATHGCGITSLAMVATYLADKPYTPPVLCALYGRYCGLHGTDVTLFSKEGPELGCYLTDRTGNNVTALEALKDGHCVISLQSVGYWTRGGHYIVLEKCNEDGTVQVRDSNLYNYKRIPQHKKDAHEWKNIINAGSTFWVFDKKVTSIPACVRCGQGEGLAAGYLCAKCRTAELRRDTYLAG